MDARGAPTLRFFPLPFFLPFRVRIIIFPLLLAKNVSIITLFLFDILPRPIGWVGSILLSGKEEKIKIKITTFDCPLVSLSRVLSHFVPFLLLAPH